MQIVSLQIVSLPEKANPISWTTRKLEKYSKMSSAENYPKHDKRLYRKYHNKPKFSRLSLSRIPRDSLKYFEISVPRHIRIAELRKNKSNNHF